MIDYQPLFDLLKERNIKISEFREGLLHPTTIANINKGDSVALTTIEKICLELDVPIERVVRILK